MLTKQKEAITVEQDIAVSPSEVYRAFTNQLALRDWLCNSADVESRVGGRIYLWWDKGYYSSGVFMDLERNKTVAFTWRGPDDPDATRVIVTLLPDGDEGTHLVLAQSGLGLGEEWSDAAFQDKRGWESALENLKSVLEAGTDLRLSRRPMFGMNGGSDLNADLIARLRLPLSEGVWLSGLMDDMAAQRAGMQRDDVLVSLGGHKITGLATFGNAMRSLHVGDTVEASFYRGATHHTVTMQLSERPTPGTPPSPEALEERVRAIYAEIDAELDAALEGVTEEEADYRISPGEWNTKEILAHLITVEQGTQSMIYSAIDDTDIHAPFFSNELLRIRAVASVYHTLPVLIRATPHQGRSVGLPHTSCAHSAVEERRGYNPGASVYSPGSGVRPQALVQSACQRSNYVPGPYTRPYRGNHCQRQGRPFCLALR